MALPVRDGEGGVRAVVGLAFEVERELGDGELDDGELDELMRSASSLPVC